MKVTVFGSGYVGLVAGACFAESGNDVICADIDPAKIDLLNKGGVPIFEPGLTDLIKRNKAQGRISFTTDLKKATLHGQFCFIAVGTPPDEDGSADLKYVLSVAKTIASYMEDHKIIIDKSTVPVGTADKVRAQVQTVLNERGAKLTFDIVSNPEFLKEGAALDDFMKPDRVVVGVDNKAAGDLMTELYHPFMRRQENMIIMDIKSAEMTKYAANSMLATKISFMNEIANLCDKVGASIDHVRRGIGSDQRIGHHFLFAGAGYGGSCFPKDVQALIKTGNQFGESMEILKAVEAVNYRQKAHLLKMVEGRFGKDLAGKKFALWGLSFKPQTDDMRDALELMGRNRINPAVMITHVGGMDCVVDTVMRLPSIPGGKKLVYTRIALPLTALDDFGKAGAANPLFAELDRITRAHNGLWSTEAEQYLLAHAKPIDSAT